MLQQHRWLMNPAEWPRRAAEACPAGQSCSSLRRFSRHELARSPGPWTGPACSWPWIPLL